MRWDVKQFCYTFNVLFMSTDGWLADWSVLCHPLHCPLYVFFRILFLLRISQDIYFKLKIKYIFQSNNLVFFWRSIEGVWARGSSIHPRNRTMLGIGKCKAYYPPDRRPAEKCRQIPCVFTINWGNEKHPPSARPNPTGLKDNNNNTHHWTV